MWKALGPTGPAHQGAAEGSLAVSLAPESALQEKLTVQHLLSLLSPPNACLEPGSWMVLGVRPCITPAYSAPHSPAEGIESLLSPKSPPSVHLAERDLLSHLMVKVSVGLAQNRRDPRTIKLCPAPSR